MKPTALMALPAIVAAQLSLAENAGEVPEHARASYQACLSHMVNTADGEMTLAELRHTCRQMLAAEAGATRSEAREQAQENALQTRREMEALNRSNRFLLTPHHRNYILPAVYTDRPNEAPFDEAYGEDVSLQNTEIEFQISLKVLIAQDLFHNNGNLYVAYTNHSYWQAYNTDISRPFRETNHEPELIVSVDNDWELFGFRNVINQVSLAHQSNGQAGSLSRSWNRIKFTSIFERGNLALALTPWYRLPEDSDKDDNPDIADYYGHYELTGAYTRNHHILSFMTRRPFSSRGALELSWSFPVSSTVRGFIQYFDGYGASLIDYNEDTQSIGLGVVFTDLF
ncbi:phospholipase A [Gilvimarinus algae]|uniref:Phospholipase A1 n=1 Tax=Gilvimarinus algae TaxID=3058037 RepID=A0ABT8TE45_9GAMM|nr:phospholipase A [Gilvimarinus sp. SDUM040014]MDO3381895.1 phospholipase A [Gilvimarinus sp. SDUM040014]